MENSEALSNEEKLRIKLEETYRNEVRSSFKDQPGNKSFKEKTWDFLNSTLGIWFLSTCVIGLITFFYSQHQQKVQLESEKKQRFEQREAERRQNEIEDARRNASLVTVLLPSLASEDKKQWRLAIEVTKYLKVKGELPGELESALEGIVISGDTSKGKVNAAAAVIDLSNNSSQGNDTSFNSLPARVYIQISGENQRDLAKSLQAKLQAANFLVPGIENINGKANSPTQTEVRYYRDEERGEAIKVVSILNSSNLGLQINDTPQKIKGNGKGTRPRHYEIWFSK